MADITVQNLTKYYGDRLILKDISFDIQPGEKVAILGANGAGKTTLLNILTGRLSYDDGHVAFGQGRTAGVIDQMPDFPPESTVEDILRLAFKESDEVAAAMDALTDEMTRKPDDASLLKRYAQLETRLEILGGYNRDYEIDRVCNGLEIAQEMRSQRFELLSGGEKTRINLARIILEQTDVLLLDEPTNHLDITSREALEEALSGYDGTLLVVSHDRYLINKLADKVVLLTPQGTRTYLGNYDAYLETRQKEEGTWLQPSDSLPAKSGEEGEKPSVNLFKERKARESELRKKRGALRRLEGAIEENEERQRALEEQLQAAATDYQRVTELSEELNQARQEGERLLEEWATLSGELEKEENREAE